MEDTEKLIKNYTEHMTISVLPEDVIRQCSSRSGAELLKKGHEQLQKGEAEQEKKKGKSNILDREFRKILFSDEEKAEIKRIVFGKRISGQVFTSYYKDISADRDESVIGWVEDTT
ncbi:MAG: hypothetical protein PUG60_07180, partial [Lachnospiraceae bacterium]|nr:hypothetical protein [Lachnospiraceae bacterium]